MQVVHAWVQARVRLPASATQMLMPALDAAGVRRPEDLRGWDEFKFR